MDEENIRNAKDLLKYIQQFQTSPTGNEENAILQTASSTENEIESQHAPVPSEILVSQVRTNMSTGYEYRDVSPSFHVSTYNGIYPSTSETRIPYTVPLTAMPHTGNVSCNSGPVHNPYSTHRILSNSGENVQPATDPQSSLFRASSHSWFMNQSQQKWNMPFGPNCPQSGNNSRYPSPRLLPPQSRYVVPSTMPSNMGFTPGESFHRNNGILAQSGVNKYRSLEQFPCTPHAPQLQSQLSFSDEYDPVQSIANLIPNSNTSTNMGLTLQPNGATISDSNAPKSNGLPNIGIFFNHKQGRMDRDSCTSTGHNFLMEKRDSLSAVSSSSALPSTVAITISSASPSCDGTRTSSLKKSISRPLQYSQRARSSVVPLSVRRSAKPKSKPAVRSPKNVLCNTRPISARKLPNRIETSSTHALGIQFPSSLDIGPIFEPNKFINRDHSQENSEPGVSWFSNQFFGQIMEDLERCGKRRHSTQTRFRSKSRDKEFGNSRRVFKTLPYNCDTYHDSQRFFNCKPCSVVLKDIRSLLNRGQLNNVTDIRKIRSMSSDTSKRMQRKAAKKPCQTSCCNNHIQERPPLRLRIYRCKPCKVVLENIWPWLKKIKRLQGKKKRKENQTNGENTVLEKDKAQIQDNASYADDEEAASNEMNPATSVLSPERTCENDNSTEDATTRRDKIKNREKLLLYICKKCNVSFPAAAECAAHLQTIHNKAYIKCSSCLKRFYTEEHFQIHIKNVCLPSKSSLQRENSWAASTASVSSNKSVSNSLSPQETSSTAGTDPNSAESISNADMTDARTPDRAHTVPPYYPDKNHFSVIKQGRSDQNFRNLFETMMTKDRISNNSDGEDEVHTLKATTNDLCHHDRDKWSEGLVSPGEISNTEAPCEMDTNPSDVNGDQIATKGNMDIRSNAGNSENRNNNGNLNYESTVGSPGLDARSAHYERQQNRIDHVPVTEIKTVEENDHDQSAKNVVKSVTNQISDTDVSAKYKSSPLITFNSAVDNLILKPPVQSMHTLDTAHRQDKTKIKISDSPVENEKIKEKMNGSSKSMIPMYRCKKCNVQFHKVSDCSKHLKTVHNKASHFKCTSCEKRFLTEPEFLNHIGSICLPRNSVKNH